MVWTPPVVFDHDPTADPGIFPTYYGGWATNSTTTYEGDTTYVNGRMRAEWAAASGGDGLVHNTSACWGFSANAGRGVFEPDSTYNATCVQERQIIRIEPGGDMLDSIVDAQFTKWMDDRGFVKGVDYDTPPEDARYKTYDWVPANEGGLEATLKPGGYIGFGVWDGGGIDAGETPGYYGASLDIREWARTFDDLPEVPAQVKEGTRSLRLEPAVQGGWPGHENVGQLLFSWPGFYPAVASGDLAGVNSWDDDDALHPVDLTSLADAAGMIKLSYTTALFEGDLPPYTPGALAPVDGGNMTIFGFNSRSQNTYLRVIARAYPLLDLPPVRFWATSALLLRWLNHMSPLVWQWLLQDAWLSIRLSMTQSYY